MGRGGKEAVDRSCFSEVVTKKVDDYVTGFEDTATVRPLKIFLTN